MLSHDDLPPLAAILGRMWNYPPSYLTLILGNLRIAVAELNDPAKRKEAEDAARKAGLYLDLN